MIFIISSWWQLATRQYNQSNRRIMWSVIILGEIEQYDCRAISHDPWLWVCVCVINYLFASFRTCLWRLSHRYVWLSQHGKPMISSGENMKRSFRLPFTVPVVIFYANLATIDNDINGNCFDDTDMCSHIHVCRLWWFVY